MTRLEDMTPAARSRRVAELVKNPRTRAAVATKFLPPQMRAEREKNARLAQPVVPGSSVTNRDLARQVGTAATLKFGQTETDLARSLAATQRQQADTAGWYQSYLNDLRQHEANIAQIGAQQQQQNAALINAIGQPQLAGAPPDASAQNQQDAMNASMIRQALTGGFGAMMAAQAGDANRYADTLAHVVGPGQQLQGLAQAAGQVTQARQKQTDLGTQEGAFKQQFADEFKQNEAKNVLAAQVAGVQSEQNQQKIDIARRLAGSTVSSRKQQASTARARVREQARADRAREANQRAGQQSRAEQAAGKVNQYGYTNAAWGAMSVAERQKVIRDFKRGGGSGSGGGPDWKTSSEQSKGRTQVVSLRNYAAKAKTGQPFVPGHAPQSKLNRHQAAQKIQQSVAAPADPILLTAALDAAYDGRISRTTVRKLIAAGYKPSLIASALGVGTGPTPRPQPGNPNIPAGKI